MKIKSYFQILFRKEPCFLALRRTLSLVRYVEGHFWLVRGKYTSHASLLHSKCSFLCCTQTNKRMDRQTESDYSTPCAQAHGVIFIHGMQCLFVHN